MPQPTRRLCHRTRGRHSRLTRQAARLRRRRQTLARDPGLGRARAPQTRTATGERRLPQAREASRSSLQSSGAQAGRSNGGICRRRTRSSCQNRARLSAARMLRPSRSARQGSGAQTDRSNGGICRRRTRGACRSHARPLAHAARNRRARARAQAGRSNGGICCTQARLIPQAARPLWLGRWRAGGPRQRQRRKLPQTREASDASACEADGLTPRARAPSR
jgi:hypothetical protein